MEQAGADATGAGEFGIEGGEGERAELGEEED